MARFDSASGVGGGESRIQVSVRQVPSATYGSAQALARGIGRAILMPSWWPADIETISYEAINTGYHIGSRRDDGSPIVVAGAAEDDWHGRSPQDWLNGDWTEPGDLTQVRGLIGWVDTPPRLHVVVYDAGLAIQLIGYRTEDEARHALASFERIEPN